MSIAKAIAAATALLLSMTALANEPATFKSLDADSNGVIDQQEAQAYEQLAESFKSADRDQDGQLSQQEFAYAMAKIRTETDPRQRG